MQRAQRHPLRLLPRSRYLSALAACSDDPQDDPRDDLDLTTPDFFEPGVDIPSGGGDGYGYGTNPPPDVADTSTEDEPDLPPPPPCDEVTFTYAGAAETVWLTGTFTDWAFTPAEGALALLESEPGLWTLTTTIADHGQHHYQLIVDGGPLIPDPANAATVSDHLGGLRSVIEVCEPSPEPDCTIVNFAYDDPAASSVRLVGSFVTWDQAQAIDLVNYDGLWRASVDLDEASYEYKFIVDDNPTWIPDPANPNQVSDGFGGFNSALSVSCAGPTGGCGDVNAFDWRDAVLYFAMVDRFHDSDNQANPVPDASDGALASGQYEGGDLQGVTDRMDYLTDLGVTALWLSAPYENRDAAGAAIDPNQDPHLYSAYHGYWPSPANTDYASAQPSPRPAVEPRLSATGDPDAELRALIDAAHNAQSANGHGVKVLFDYVMNHVDDQSPLYQAHPDWFVNVDGRVVLCAGDSVCNGACWDHPEWSTRCAFTNYLPAFDYTNPAARAWSIDDALWWAQEYDIDGYRLDAIKHVPIEWLTELRARLDADIPDPDGDRFYLVGETFTWADYDLLAYYVDPDTRLDGQFDFPWRKEVCEATMGNGNFEFLRGFMDFNDTRYGADALMSTWIGNHDIPRVIHNATGTFNCTQGSYADIGWNPQAYTQPPNAEPYEKLRLAFAIMFTNPGVPLLYYGDEIGLAGGGDPDNRRPMIWNDTLLNTHQLALRESVRELANLRAQNKALTRGRRTTLSVSPDAWVYRMGGCGADAPDVIVALNRAPQPASLTIPPGAYTDLSSNAPTQGGAISVPPRGYRILRAE